ncbi:MAG TPA: hypothetical protein VMG82_11605 [Candidatus Sulfotelmatobacter sp.]|nr:hypothetical protein [Candidatus Sulfotelmatobacter sp.]
MKDQDPRRTARRNARRKNRFGSNNFCLFCGYSCLESLTQVSRRWLAANGVAAELLNRLLEDHHAHGEAHDPDLLVTLCLNCHREITEGLLREGVSMYPETNVHKLVALKLRASAVLLESLASSYRDSATLLEESDES